eukprot:Tbor_TRINITY_DN6231_c9_g2::TRINITY_DN6231_c9_g2_i11::g.1748::m.1748
MYSSLISTMTDDDTTCDDISISMTSVPNNNNLNCESNNIFNNNNTNIIIQKAQHYLNNIRHTAIVSTVGNDLAFTSRPPVAIYINIFILNIREYDDRMYIITLYTAVLETLLIWQCNDIYIYIITAVI